jgi:hypothetical protein
MITRISMALMCAVMLVVFGCDFGAPQVPPPSGNGDSSQALFAVPPVTATSLNSTQVGEVLSCQQAIMYWGEQFTGLKEKYLDDCLYEALDTQVRFETGQITSTQYNQELSKERRDCSQWFTQIGQGSTSLVNGIVNACGPVQSLILPDSGYDALQFGALTRDQKIVLVADATGLAGRICGAKELFVDALVALQVPRMVGLLKVLDNGTGQFAISGPPSTLLGLTPTLPNIPLDTRCTLPSLP